MARGVKLWAGGVTLVCLVAGLVYLPPKGAPQWSSRGSYSLPETAQQRLRARELALQWQEVNGKLLGASYRGRFGPLLAQQESSNKAGPALVMEGDTAVIRFAEPLVRAAIDSAWARLGIGFSKISVGILLRRSIPPGKVRHPFAELNGLGSIYLLPDSVDRSTCLVVSGLPRFATERNFRTARLLAEWGIELLGPCAFYARFGVPSPRVEQWLAARSFDVAISPSWDQPKQHSYQLILWMFRNPVRQDWWWDGVYSYPASTLACFAGRPEVCRAELARFDHGGQGRRPKVVVPPDAWQASRVNLIGAQSYLASMVRTVGIDRFQEFWNTSLPVDSALTLAVQKPVGEYTVSWLRGFSYPPRFGAATRWLDALLGLGFAVVIMALAILGQTRRQVR